MGSSKSKNAPKEAAPEEGQEAQPLKTINEDEESSAVQRKEPGKKPGNQSRTVRINVTGDDGEQKELKRGSASSAPASYSRLQSGVDKRGQDIGKMVVVASEVKKCSSQFFRSSQMLVSGSPSLTSSSNEKRTAKSAPSSPPPSPHAGRVFTPNLGAINAGAPRSNESSNGSPPPPPTTTAAPSDQATAGKRNWFKKK